MGIYQFEFYLLTIEKDIGIFIKGLIIWMYK